MTPKNNSFSQFERNHEWILRRFAKPSVHVEVGGTSSNLRPGEIWESKQREALVWTSHESTVQGLCKFAYLHVPKELGLIQFNNVPRLELQQFEKDSARRATRNRIANGIEQELPGSARIDSRHVPVDHIVYLHRVFVPFGRTRNQLVALILTRIRCRRLVIVVIQVPPKVVDQTQRQTRNSRATNRIVCF